MPWNATVVETPVKRQAIERYAVGKVTERLVSEGWEVADVGDEESWDLIATRADQLLHVEVKGSTTVRSGIDLILQPGLLTLAELWLGAVWERGQPPSIMDGCVD
ncbi:protein NO VEIN domain-containing protein [Micromonospora sp. NPDC005163]